jgi:ABC-type bacteriocin/lantibiotic exporter with double-glycine peptidase domain
MKSSTLATVKKSLYVLPKSAQKQYLLACGAQIFLSFLDLAGLAIVAGIGSVSIHAISGSEPGALALRMLEILQIDQLSTLWQIGTLGVLTILLFSGKTLLSVILIRKVLRFLSHKGAELSSELTSRVLNQDLLVGTNWSTQELMFNTTYGVNVISNSILGTSVSVVSDLSLTIVIALGIFVADYKIAVFSILIFVPLFVGAYFSLKKVTLITGRKITELNLESNKLIIEVINAFRELSVRNQKAFYVNQISNTRSKLAESLASQALIPNAMKYFVDFSLIVGTFLLSIGLFMTESASHAIAGITVFLAASSRFAPALLRLQQNFLTISNGAGQAENTLSLLKESVNWEKIHPTVSKFETNHAGFTPRVQIEDLDFRYSTNSRSIISSFNMVIQPGEYVAIVGPSGAGKTTLVDLLLGIHKPTSGSIRVSELSPREAAEKWPGALSYVPQNSYLGYGTVRSNICLGYSNLEIPDENIWQALEAAKMREIIEQLPGQLEAPISEHGTNLSGGQKQRLGIARALITNPKILVLDEATSSLDNQTESLVATAISGMKGTRTIIVIAHRLSTVKDADRVILFSPTKGILQGTYQSLITEIRKIDPSNSLELD